MKGNSNYLKLIVFVVLTLVSFIGALTSAFFGGAGLFYGQGVYEVDVLSDKYKYECNILNASADPYVKDVDAQGNCNNFNTSSTLDSFTNYETYRDDINANVTDYMNGYTIVFTLLTLVFLFMALREIGVFKSGSSSKKDAY